MHLHIEWARTSHGAIGNFLEHIHRSVLWLLWVNLQINWLLTPGSLHMIWAELFANEGDQRPFRFSFAFDSAHVKYGVWPGPKYNKRKATKWNTLKCYANSVSLFFTRVLLTVFGAVAFIFRYRYSVQIFPHFSTNIYITTVWDFKARELSSADLWRVKSVGLCQTHSKTNARNVLCTSLIRSSIC